MKNKQIRYIKMNVSYYGIYFTNVKYYPAKEEVLDFHSLRTEDGYWFGIDLNRQIPINIHLFFFDGRWNTNCEYCKRDDNGEWNHFYDSNIYCENVKVKYIH